MGLRSGICHGDGACQVNCGLRFAPHLPHFASLGMHERKSNDNGAIFSSDSEKPLVDSRKFPYIGGVEAPGRSAPQYQHPGASVGHQAGRSSNVPVCVCFGVRHAGLGWRCRNGPKLFLPMLATLLSSSHLAFPIQLGAVIAPVCRSAIHGTPPTYAAGSGMSMSMSVGVGMSISIGHYSIKRALTFRS